jgi:hypothetical protein
MVLKHGLISIEYVTLDTRNIQPDDGHSKGPKYVVAIANICIPAEANKT